MSISQIVNQYSYLWLMLALLGVAALVLWRRGHRRSGAVIFVALALAILAGWAVIHPRETSVGAASSQVQSLIGKGTPVLLEFQSPY
jgi:hypothetical protein